MKTLSPLTGTPRSVSDKMVVAGMLAATVIAALLVAAFFVVVRRLSRQQVREALVSTATPLSGPSRMDEGG
jgi:hypothetical protein